MAEILFPDGYGTARITMAEMQRRHAHLMEPEFARRLFAWIASKGGKFGIGDGWRPTPSNTSQASMNGQSFHQTQKFSDGYQGYTAVDLVAYNPGHVHRALTRAEAVWQGSAAAKTVGVHMNVDTETWHMQPIEIDGWQTWANAGRTRPHPGYTIPGSIPVVPPPTLPGFPPFDPVNGLFSLYPIATNKVVLKQGMLPQPNDWARYFQGVMRHRANYIISIDGYYGGQSVAAAKAVQGWNRLKQDGIVGPQTWAIIDAMAKR